MFTDSRYWTQAEAELAGSGVDLVKLDGPAIAAYVRWLTDLGLGEPAPAAQGGVLQQAGVEGARRQFGDGGGAGDGDGVGTLGLHRRAGDGDEHEEVGLTLGGRRRSSPQRRQEPSHSGTGQVV